MGTSESSTAGCCSYYDLFCSIMAVILCVVIYIMYHKPMKPRAARSSTTDDAKDATPAGKKRTDSESKASRTVLERKHQKKSKPAKKSSPREEFADDFESDDEPPSDDQYVYHKMVLVVRTDLKMKKGKIAAQCSHATLGVYRHIMRKRQPEWMRGLSIWSSDGQPKIVLKVGSEKHMLQIMQDAVEAGIPSYIVQDAGRTQVPAGSCTVLALGPAVGAAIDELTGNLKLM